MFLVTIKGQNPGSAFLLKKGATNLAGRGRGSDIQILDSLVSRQHYQIEERDGNYYIKDLGSTNKTFVNKKLLAEEKKLQFGDLIEAGEAAFLFTDQKDIPIKSVDDFDKLRINQTLRINVSPKENPST
jgi:pSer/pThr/pTyr-binding forkhead associated (FHA) protein